MPLAVCLTACRIQPPRVSPEEEVSRVIGIEDAVRFQFEGASLDVERSAVAGLALADALRAALESDPGLQAALARVRAAQAEAGLAGRFPNPILDLVLRFPEGGGGTDIEAGLSADLLALLQRPRRAGAAGHRLQSEAALVLATALDLVAGVQEQYAEVQALEELVLVLGRRSALFARLREIAEARLDLGAGTLHELTTLQSEQAALELDVARRGRELLVARLGLARRIGEPSAEARWELEAWSAPEPVPGEEAPWIAAALSARPEMLAIEWEIRAREDEEALARGEPFAGTSLGVDAERDGDWSVGPGLALPLPIFDAGGLRVERARALTAEERHHLTEARRVAVEEVRAALAVMLGAQDDLARVLRDLLPLQERRRQQVEEAYRLGHVDATALLLAEQALQAAQADRIELEREVSGASYRLQRAVGGPSVFQSVLRPAPEPKP